MLKQSGLLLRDCRQKEIVRLIRFQQRSFEKRNRFVERELVLRGLDVLRDGIGEPGAVVGDAGAHALAGMRQPPMLHVALDELTGRRAQQMFARQIGASRDQRHAVLQLIAEPIGAAGLIEGRTRPDPAGERLVEEPAVEHEVHRSVGRLDLNRAQHIVPQRRDSGLEGVEIGRAIDLHGRAGGLPRGGLSQKEDHFGHAARRHFERRAHRGASVQGRRRPCWIAAPRSRAPPDWPARHCDR